MRPRARVPGHLLLLVVAAGCRGDRSDEPRPASASGGAGLSGAIQRAEWRRLRSRPLLRALEHDDARWRARAALALGRIGETTGLLPLLDDRDAEVRRQVAFALRLATLDRLQSAGDPQLTGDPRVARALGRRLRRERQPAVRQALLLALGWTGDTDARAALRPYLGRAGALRRAALVAWGLLVHRGRLEGDALGSETLSGLLGPTAPTPARGLAAWVFERAGGSERPEVRRALRALVDDRTAALQQRIWAVRALGAAPSDRHRVLWLQQHLLDDLPAIQVEAARALARAGPRGAVKLAQGLVELWQRVARSHDRLTGPQIHPVWVGIEALRPHARIPTVRAAAEQLLELSDGGEAVVQYGRLEAHAVDLVHCAAAGVVDLGRGRLAHSGTCGTAHAPALDTRWRRAGVATLIGQFERDAVWRITLLRRYLGEPDGAVRAAAVGSLAQIDSPLIELPLDAALRDPDAAVLAQAAAAIARRAKRLPRQALGRALGSRLARMRPMVEPEAACAVVDALAAVKYLGAVPLLEQLVRRPPRAVQRCVLAALRTLTGRPVAPPSVRRSRGLPDLRWAGNAALPRQAILVTRRGEIELELWPDEAPATVANFARLAARRFYRGLRFHRVVPNFVVQGGDPHGDGWGGPGYTIPCELTPRPYVAGSVGMALAGRDTGGSQFFISLGRHPRLDGRYTQFGRVVRGMEVVRRLLPNDEIKDLYVPRPTP